MAIQQYPAAATGSTAASAGAQTFTSSGNWTAPAGVTAVTYTLVGGGGGGGGASNSTSNANYNFPAGGGAGGEIATGKLTVTPGSTYAVVVGAGGAGASATTSTATFTVAQAGGYSSLGLSYTLENAGTNGAFESGTTGWLTGQANYMGAANFPTWTSGYNGDPGTGNTGYTNSSTVATVTNVTVSGSTRFGYNTYGVSPGGSDYKDMLLKVPVTAGTTYTFSAYGGAYNTSQSPYLRIRIIWLSSFGSTTAISTSNSTGGYYSGQTSWTRFSVTDTAPSGATWAVLCCASWDYDSRWTGIQLEGGSSVTDYIGPNVAGSYKTISGLGIITATAGAVANGGGGGESSQTGSRLAGIGFGGGAAMSGGGSYVVGGNGYGAGNPGQINLLANSTSMPYINTLNTVSNGGAGFGSGGPALQLNSTNQGYIVQANGAGAVNGYGAGGMGARGSQTIPGIPGFGAAAPVTTSSAGGNGTANTGAGGGGGQNSTNASTSVANGGTGGSGIVVLSW